MQRLFDVKVKGSAGSAGQMIGNMLVAFGDIGLRLRAEFADLSIQIKPTRAAILPVLAVLVGFVVITTRWKLAAATIQARKARAQLGSGAGIVA